MYKLITGILVLVLLLSGCSIVKVDNTSVKGIIDTVLYKKNSLNNVSFEGYKFYLPKGVKVVDKNDFNIKLKDNNQYYYLYIDTIAYHYKTKNSYNINTEHYYSDILSNDEYFGFVDIEKVEDRYFVVLMYNYAKIEAYIECNELSRVLTNASYVLSTIKYNDDIINSYINDTNSIFQEEKFDIFSSDHENSNLLTYDDVKIEDTEENEDELDISEDD